jgi:hypothetical protein
MGIDRINGGQESFGGPTIEIIYELERVPVPVPVLYGTQISRVQDRAP